jgi:hypothetical protein
MDYGSIKTWTIRGLIGFVLAAIVAFVFPPIQPLIKIDGGITIFGRDLTGGGDAKRPAPVTNPLTVNYSLAVADAMRSSDFTVSDKDFLDLQTKESTDFGERVVDIKLFNFGWKIIELEVESKPNGVLYATEWKVIEYIRTEMAKEGYRPAVLAELIAFGVQYPNKPFGFNVIASETRSTRSVKGAILFTYACLNARAKPDKRLTLSLEHSIGNPIDHFLGVRK